MLLRRPCLLLALVLTLSGCHLIFRYEDRPVLPDGPALEDGGAPDLAPSDLQRTENGQPDSGKIDTGGFYIKEPFSNGMGVLKSRSCTWSVKDGLIHQTDTTQNGCHALADVPANDYSAETYVQIHAIKGIPDWTEGAGLAVRVTKTNYYPPVPPAMYVCAISPDAGELVLARCPGGKTNDCLIMDRRTANISLGTPYRIQARVKGMSVECYLPDQGKSIVYPVLDLLKGGVGLVTFFARASYDYLWVWP